jgi:hypothetical protein
MEMHTSFEVIFHGGHLPVITLFVPVRPPELNILDGHRFSKNVCSFSVHWI